MRNRVLNIFFVFLFLILLLGLFNLGLVRARVYKKFSDKNCIRLLNQPGSRGLILDRNGKVMVDNTMSYDLLILPEPDDDLELTFRGLSKALHLAPEDLMKRFEKNYLGPSLPVVLLRDLDIKKAIAVEEMKSDFNSIIIQQRPQRHYPYARLASHVIGYVNEIDRWRLTKLGDYGYKTKDLVGFGGVEEKYDYYLRQEDGGSLVEVDHQGKFSRLLSFRPPQSGKDIWLTIDLEAQKVAEEALSDKKGAVIIMDPNNGQILAMASKPDFNPSIFIDKEKYSLDNVFANPEAPLVNRAATGIYPAGSVFKVVVATAGLESGKINPYTSFLCSGTIKIGAKEFDCSKVHGQQDLISAIAHSCNIFFYRAGLAVGPQQMHDYALDFGLSSPTSVDLPYESSGFVPSVLWRKVSRFKKWFSGDTANFSIGQGDLLVTPLQITRMMAVFANNGTLVTPYIVKTIDASDMSAAHRKFTKLAFKPATLFYIRQGLRGAVLDPEGTAHILSGLSVTVAGKTGTAQAPPGVAHGWFAGFFPFKNPKYVICVFLERGGAGANACAVAKEIIERMQEKGLIVNN